MKKTLFSVIILFHTVSSWTQCDLDPVIGITNVSHVEKLINDLADCEYKTATTIIVFGDTIQDFEFLNLFDTIISLSIVNNSAIEDLDFLQNIFIDRIRLENLENFSEFNEENNKFNSIFIKDCNSLDQVHLIKETYNALNFISSTPMVVTIDKPCIIQGLEINGDVKIDSPAQLYLQNYLNLYSSDHYTSFSDLIENINIDELFQMQIWGFDFFDSKGFPNESSINSINFLGIKNLNTEGFAQKSAALSSLSFQGVRNIKNFKNFELFKVNSLRIVNADALETLDFIPSLGGSFSRIFVNNCPVLDDISYLENISELRSIGFRDNPLLMECDVKLICDMIDVPQKFVTIANNAGDCIDKDAVRLACEANAISDVCNFRFNGVLPYDQSSVLFPFDITMPTIHRSGCMGLPSHIDFYLDGKEQKLVHREIIADDSDINISVNFPVLIEDFNDEDYDCIEILMYDQCDEYSCTDYICHPLKRETIAPSNDIDIYPNPIENSVSVRSETNLVKIKVLDSHSSVLLDNEVSGKIVDLNLQYLPSGLYIIQMETEEGFVQSKKVVKM